MALFLKNCCCGCSLRAGTFIIGVLNFLFTGIFFIICLYNIISPDYDILDVIRSDISRLPACVAAHYLIIVALLIIGTLKGKLWLMIPWIGLQISTLICIPVVLIPLFFITRLSVGPPEFVARFLILLVISIMIIGYFTWVVASHFEEIRKKQAQFEVNINHLQINYPSNVKV